MDVLGIPIYQLATINNKRRLEQLDDVEVVDASETKGALLAWDYSTSKWGSMPAGSDGQVLTAQSGQTMGLQYQTPTVFSAPVTTKGDLFGFSTVNARVPVGSAYQVLQADSTNANGVSYAGILSDASGVTSVKYQNRTLNDSAGNGSLDYQNRQLLDSLGAPQLDFSTGTAASTEYIQIKNATDGFGAVIKPAGAGSNISMTLQGKGTNTVFFSDGTDVTKRLTFAMGNSSTNTQTKLQTFSTGNRTINLPDASDTLVGLAAAQTLTNKTLTLPVISSISNSGTLTLPSGPGTLALTSQLPTGIHIASGTLVDADITGMPKVLIPAQGANTLIVPIAFMMGPCTGGYSGGSNAELRNGNASGNNFSSIIGTAFFTTGGIIQHLPLWSGAAAIANIINQSLSLVVSGASFTGTPGVTTPWCCVYLLTTSGVPT